MNDTKNDIRFLSDNQINWAFDKVKELIFKYNNLKMKEMTDDDWENLVAEVLDFGNNACRGDSFCRTLVLDALEYLQYSKKNEEQKTEWEAL